MAWLRDSRRYRASLWLVGRLGAGLLRALGATWRVAGEGPDPFASGGTFVAGTWHRGLLVAAYLWRDRGLAVPVSRSRDGDRIEVVLQRLGYAPSPRGSSSRGASALLRAMIRCVGEQTSVAVLLDGPRGPARTAKPGLLALSRATGAAIVPVGIAAHPSVRFGSWDRALLPLPFARVRYRYGQPLRVPRRTTPPELERLRAELQRSLDELTGELDRALGVAGALPVPAVPARPDPRPQTGPDQA